MALIKLCAIGVLCLVLKVGLSESKVAVRRHYYPEKYIAIEFPSLVNTTLSYAACDNTKKQPEKNCSVVIESINFDGAYRRDNCNLVFKAERKDGIVSDMLSTVPFGDDRVIVAWLEIDKNAGKIVESSDRANFDSLLKINTVHFPSCKVVESKIPLNYIDGVFWWFYNLFFVTYSNGFDVALSESKSCDYQFCKISFDSEGKKISDPVPWFNASGDSMLESAAAGSPAKGHILLNYGHRSVYLIRDNNEKVLKHLARRQQLVGVSNSHNTLRTCYSDQNTVGCTQFDDEGNTKLETNIDFPYPVMFVMVHNTPSTEFFLFYLECLASQCTKNVKYHVAKVGGDGKIKKDIEIEGFQCDMTENAMYPRFSENQPGKLCLSLMCFENVDRSSRKKSRGYFNFGVECFNYTDF